MAFSPDGRFLLAESTLWEVETGELIHSFEGYMHGMNPKTFSMDGRLALTGTNLWDTESGKVIHTFDEPDIRITIEEFLALQNGHRMRVHFSYLIDGLTGKCNEVLSDPEIYFPDNPFP